MSARIRLALVGICVVGAALLAVLATDTLRWPGAMRAGDVRYADEPTRSGIWHLTGAFPFGAGRGLLGLGDDIAYREALQSFWRGEPRMLPFSDSNFFGIRAHAQQELTAIALHDSDSKRGSAAANLVGVLGFANAVFDQERSQIYLANAVDSFRTAIRLDPDNEDAKYNLELALVRLRVANEQNESSTGSSSGRRGASAGTGEPGTGY
jgi:hypothetical protein